MALAISTLCFLLGALAGGFVMFMLRHADGAMGVEDTALGSLSEPKR